MSEIRLQTDIQYPAEKIFDVIIEFREHIERFRARFRPVTTFSTASRAHLRRAGPDGLDVNARSGRGQSVGR
jgi:hypothetical protein